MKTDDTALWKRILATVVLATGMLPIGFLVGAFLGGRIFGEGSGFDRLADALGGGMIGAVAAALLALFAARWLTVPQRLIGGGLGIAVLVAMLLAARGQQQPPLEMPPRPTTVAPDGAD